MRRFKLFMRLIDVIAAAILSSAFTMHLFTWHFSEGSSSCVYYVFALVLTPSEGSHGLLSFCNSPSAVAMTVFWLDYRSNVSHLLLHVVRLYCITDSIKGQVMFVEIVTGLCYDRMYYSFCCCCSVDDKCMLRYIRDKTAAPYFSNLVWFIGSHVLELDACVRDDIEYE